MRVFRRPSHTAVVAYLALFVAATGTASAATGGSFLLGTSNSASHPTVLENTGSGPALRVKTKSTHSAPLSVSGNSTKIRSHNADLLDGLDSGRLQRSVRSACGYSGTIGAIGKTGAARCGPRVYWAVVRAGGTLARGSKGVKVLKLAGNGAYQVTFGENMRTCSYVANVGDPGAKATPLGFTTTATSARSSKAVFVQTWNASLHAANESFQLIVACAAKRA